MQFASASMVWHGVYPQQQGRELDPWISTISADALLSSDSCEGTCLRFQTTHGSILVQNFGVECTSSGIKILCRFAGLLLPIPSLIVLDHRQRCGKSHSATLGSSCGSSGPGKLSMCRLPQSSCLITINIDNIKPGISTAFWHIPTRTGL